MEVVDSAAERLARCLCSTCPSGARLSGGSSHILESFSQKTRGDRERIDRSERGTS
jgi:hypothetical protein